MLFASDPYVMLIGSLPAIGPLLSDKEPPINRTRLDERLKMLEPEDRAELDALGTIVSWAALDPSEDDVAFLERAERIVAAVRGEDLRRAARDRLEIRTLIAALRRRHAGEDAPPDGVRWGYGRFVERIRAHWGEPDFGVGRIFPWVLAAKEQLEAGETTALERIVLEAAWNSGTRHELGHAFDFEAVAFYLLRWSLNERWARYDADAAAARFAALLDAAFVRNETTLQAAE
jgi:hypothetical protein